MGGVVVVVPPPVVEEDVTVIVFWQTEVTVLSAPLLSVKVTEVLYVPVLL